MIWEPRDMPRLREDVAVWATSAARMVYLRALADGTQELRPLNMPDTDAATYLAREEFHRLSRAELFHVSGQMTELIKVSSETIPTFALKPEDLPAPYGFIYFAQPIQVVDYEEAAAPIVAASWGPMNGNSPFPNGAVWITTYSDNWAVTASRVERGSFTREAAELVRRAMPRLCIDNESLIPFSSEPIADDPRGERRNEIPRMIRSAWMLMGQQISETEILVPDRALRRRYRKDGREAPTVRVIGLRRPRTTSEYSGEGHREFNHQWIVRGHWRKQWYPSVNDHRPVWITPHIKGPEGAPLLGGDRVYSLKR